MLAVKIRCRKRRTSSSAVRQSIASQPGGSSSGPFTTTTASGVAVAVIVMASNLSFGSGVVVSVSVQAHLTRVGTLSGPGIRPCPASYPARSAEGRPRCPGFLLPFGRRHSLLGSSFARQGIRPSSRSADRYEYESAFGPWRGYHVPHAQATTGLGASCIPRAAVLTRPTRNPRPTPAALPRPAPTPCFEQPISKAHA